VLVGCREPLAECYTPDNGRPALEPVVLRGVLILQFLERVPDRQAVEMVKYHLGWKLALNLKLSDPGFHPTTLGYFRQRLLEHAKGDLAFRAVLGALQAEGFIPKRCKQRLEKDARASGRRRLERVGMRARNAAARLGRTGRSVARSRPARPAGPCCGTATWTVSSITAVAPKRCRTSWRASRSRGSSRLSMKPWVPATEDVLKIVVKDFGPRL
jgi:hypothetical protein